MMATPYIIFLSLITFLIGVNGHPIITLDIGKQGVYYSGNHNIKVEKHVKDGQEFYKHIHGERMHISDIMVDGQYIHSDFIPPTNELAHSSLVYWRNDKPEMMAIRFDKEEIILWNNGNGRLVSQASSIFTYPNVFDRQVVLDIGWSTNGRYGQTSLTARTDMFIYPFTEPELPGYQICRHTGPPFMVKSVMNGSVLTDIKVVPEVHNVYVYKWNNVPLLVEFELFNKEIISFAHVENKWEPAKTLKYDDYRRKHDLREWLNYINWRNGNRVVIDISKKAGTNRPVTYSGERCIVKDSRTATDGSVTVEKYTRGDIKEYEEHKHRLSNHKPFDIMHVVNGKNRVIINLPNKPVKSFSFFTRPNATIVTKVKDYIWTNKSMLFIEVVTDVYEYYMHNGGEEFVKYAISDRQLREKMDFFSHEPGKIVVWKNGRLAKT